MGGKERSEKHATNTANVINKARPTFVRVRNLTVIDGTPIEKMIGKGITLLNAKEQLEELMMLIEGIKIRTYFTCDHISNYLFTKSGTIFFGVHGKLPEEKKIMLEQIEDTVRTVEVLEKSGERVFTSNDMYKMGLIGL